MSTVICLIIETCHECPKIKETRTMGAGYAFDYWCTVVDRKIAGYVEYASEDIKEVPDWCPLRR